MLLFCEWREEENSRGVTRRKSRVFSKKKKKNSSGPRRWCNFCGASETAREKKHTEIKEISQSGEDAEMRPCSDQLVHTETHWNMQPFLYLILLCHCKWMQAGDVCDFKTVGWGRRIYSVYFGWTTRLGGHLSPSSPSFTSSSAPHFSPLSCFNTVVRQPLRSLFCPLPPSRDFSFTPTVL